MAELKYDPETGRYVDTRVNNEYVQQTVPQGGYTLPEGAERDIYNRQLEEIRSGLPSVQYEPNFGGGLGGVTPPQHTPTLLTNSNDARDNMARIHRSMWEDYKRRFIPARDALMASVGDHEATLKQVGQSVDQAFGVGSPGSGIRGQQSRQFRGLGLNMSPDQRESLQRNNALRHSKAKVGALNTARTHLKDRDMATMARGLGALAKQRQDSK